MNSNVSKEYTIAELARDIGVSKATVYNKIQDFQNILESHINVKKGIKYLDITGFQIIKDSIGVSKNRNHILERLETLESTDEKLHEIKDSSQLETLERYVESLESQIEFLKEDNIFLKEHLSKEIEAKNRQLEAKDQLLQNFQVLLREQKMIQEAPKEKFLRRILKKIT